MVFSRHLTIYFAKLQPLMDIISIIFKPFNLENCPRRNMRHSQYDTWYLSNHICQNSKWGNLCDRNTFNDGSTCLNIISARLMPAMTPSSLAIKVASAFTSVGYGSQTRNIPWRCWRCWQTVRTLSHWEMTHVWPFKSRKRFQHQKLAVSFKLKKVLHVLAE